MVRDEAACTARSLDPRPSMSTRFSRFRGPVTRRTGSSTSAIAPWDYRAQDRFRVAIPAIGRDPLCSRLPSGPNGFRGSVQVRSPYFAPRWPWSTGHGGPIAICIPSRLRRSTRPATPAADRPDGSVTLPRSASPRPLCAALTYRRLTGAYVRTNRRLTYSPEQSVAGSFILLRDREARRTGRWSGVAAPTVWT